MIVHYPQRGCSLYWEKIIICNVDTSYKQRICIFWSLIVAHSILLQPSTSTTTRRRWRMPRSSLRSSSVLFTNSQVGQSWRQNIYTFRTFNKCTRFKKEVKIAGTFDGTWHFLYSVALLFDPATVSRDIVFILKWISRVAGGWLSTDVLALASVYVVVSRVQVSWETFTTGDLVEFFCSWSPSKRASCSRSASSSSTSSGSTSLTYSVSGLR